MPECKLALHINLVILGALAASLRPVIANQLPVSRRQQTICQVLILLSPIWSSSFLCAHGNALQYRVMEGRLSLDLRCCTASYLQYSSLAVLHKLQSPAPIASLN